MFWWFVGLFFCVSVSAVNYGGSIVGSVRGGEGPGTYVLLIAVFRAVAFSTRSEEPEFIKKSS